ncbi:MAG TPA: GntR family transcriptional regulator [Candidatus Dormibacteraeota bacterium]
MTDLVYGRLRAMILRGMAPGTPLRLNELASELGVSTTPIRVAVERLRSEGLVVHRRGKGSSVAPLSVADLEDIYAVRNGLEGVAARLGAPRLSDDEIGVMRHCAERLGQLDHSASRDRKTYLAVEWAMHEVCYGAAGYPRLLQEIRSYRHQTERYFRLALAEGINARDDLQHQIAFFEACAGRDPAGAEARARDLLEWTVERVAALLQGLPDCQPDEEPTGAPG